MRLQEMYCLIQNTLENWVEPEFSEKSQNNSREIFYRSKNSLEVLQMLEPLAVLPSVEKKLKMLESSIFITNPNRYFPPSEKSEIDRLLEGIKIDLCAMEEMCETLGVAQNPSGFDVKLPPAISLDELASLVKDLNTIFTQCPTLNQDDSKIEFKGVDVGSIWMTFSVIGASITIFSALAALIDKAVIVRSHWLTCKQQQETIRSLGLANDLLESQIKIHQTTAEKLQEQFVSELADANDISDPENQERIKLSLSLLTKWMDRGMEIHASIKAPDGIKAVFPPIGLQSLPEINPKLLNSEAESKESE